MELRNIDIHTLLPQQQPFVIVGALTHYSDTRVCTTTVIPDNDIFVSDNVIMPFALAENIAQTCAARIGYINKYILHKDIQIGVIAAIRNCHICALPHVGDTIHTQVDIIEDIFDMTLAKAVITSGGTVVTTAEITLKLSNA